MSTFATCQDSKLKFLCYLENHYVRNFKFGFEIEIRTFVNNTKKNT